ncbi:MAG TPA: hypothetical protein ENN74_01195 [Firmicutes bacterium]|nr:hypothetical protein [Bacillota bacterium]
MDDTRHSDAEQALFPPILEGAKAAVANPLVARSFESHWKARHRRNLLEAEQQSTLADSDT